MRKRYVAFYWTRWVPRQYMPGSAQKKGAGFTSLSENPDEAARQSRTIRYQRELIKRYVRDAKGELAYEVTYLEKHIDRGSGNVEAPLRKAADLCRELDATLLYADFWANKIPWRRHGHMARVLEHIRERGSVDGVPIDDPDKMPINVFDLIKHFQQWDERMKYSDDHRRIVEDALREIAPKHTGWRRYKPIAQELNANGVPTLSGRGQWTPEMVRQLIRYRLRIF